jgi:hypothetical protein
MKFVFYIYVLILAGCSSIVSGTKQLVQVNTTCDGQAIISSCKLTNENGTWSGGSYSRIQIQKGFGNLTIQCKSPVFNSETLIIKSESTTPIYANAILGGGIGAIYDINNGSGFIYPETINFKISNCPTPVTNNKANNSTAETPQKKESSNYKYKDYIHFPPLKTN